MSCRELSRFREHNIKHNDIPFLSRIMRFNTLTHWSRVTHICVVKLISIGSDNGLWPGRRQAIIWTNAGILLIGPLGTNINFNRHPNIFIQENALEYVVREVASILSWPQCVKKCTKMESFVVRDNHENMQPDLVEFRFQLYGFITWDRSSYKIRSSQWSPFPYWYLLCQMYICISTGAPFTNLY